MVRFVAYALVSILALGSGSWIGLGRPSVEDSVTLARTELARAGRTLTNVPPRHIDGPAPREDPPPPPVDGAKMPDLSPFPRLNPEETARGAWLLAEGPAHPAADLRRVVTLTFDDGPFPETTPEILDLLANHHVRATFFWIGRYLDGNDDRAITTRAVARKVAAAGHIIGNHTHDHLPLTLLAHAQAMAQIDDGANSIERIIGVRPVLFRPPYGAVDAWASGLLRSRGLELVLWSIEAEDMTHGDSSAMAESLEQQIEYAGGGIVLLHDIRRTTIPVLASLLDWLDAHAYDANHPEKLGYETVDMVEYMRETQRSPQPFADRATLEQARSVEWRVAHPRRPAPRAHHDNSGGELAM